MTTFDHSIRIESQTATASVDVPGTDLSLHYASDRVFGRAGGRTIQTPLTGSTPPDSLKRVELTIEVAGQHHEFEFPAEPDQTHDFVWDGRDAYGNRMQGSETATVELTYVYDGSYQPPDSDSRAARSFGRQNVTRTDVELVESRNEVKIPTEWRVELSALSAADLLLGGWTLSSHHLVDVHDGTNRKTLWAGNGRTRSIPGVLSHVVDRVRPGRTGAILDDNERFRRFSVDVSGDGVVTVAASTRTGVGDLLYQFDRSEVDRLIGPDAEPLSAVAERIAGSARNTAYGEDIRSGVAAEDTTLAYLTDVASDDDGTVYIAEQDVQAVRRIDADGVIELFAGTTENAVSGYQAVYDSVDEWWDATDGEVASEVPINNPAAVAPAPDGNVYVSMDVGRYGVVSRVSTDGRIHHAARFEDGVPEVMACGPGGDVFLGMRGRVVRMDAQNTLTLVAGREPENAVLEEGARLDTAPDHRVSAKGAAVGEVVGIDVAADGEVFVVDRVIDADESGSPAERTEYTIRRFRPGGAIYRVAGYGDDAVNEDTTLEGVYSNTVAFADDVDVSLGPGSELFFTGNNEFNELGHVVGRVSMSDDADELFFASSDGTEVYEFQDGRHAATHEFYSGETVAEFSYGESGALAEVTHADGATLTVERDDDGTPTALVAPGGQRLDLDVADGYLVGVTFPDGRSLSCEYDGGGLLQSITQPGGDVTAFEYDEVGRLVARERATGGRDELVRSITDDGYEVSHVTPEMRETTITTDRIAAGKRITTQCCGGAAEETLITPDGEWQTTLKDGGSRTTETAPDPRFGSQKTYSRRTTYETPGGVSHVTELSRTVSQRDRTDPLTVDSITDTTTTNGRTHERVYDADADRFDVTTPEGRTVRLLRDGGELSAIDPDGVDSLPIRRNGDGRIGEFGRSGATLSLEYDDGGHPNAVVDPEGRRSEFAVDDAGLPASFTTPEGHTTAFQYDDDGFLSGVTRPNGDVHSFDADAAGNLSEYTPPDGETFSMGYDDDGLPSSLSMPSGRTLSNTYGSGGRLQEATHPDATVTYDRDAADRLTELVRTPDDGSDEQRLRIDRDGDLVTERSFQGAVSGSFEYDHDADGRVDELTFPDGTTRSFGHDDDGLVTTVGPFTFDRDGPMGRVSRIGDGTLTVDVSYDDHGRISDRTHEVDGQTVYDVSYTYDDSDLIVERTETVAGSSRTESFTYDDDGQLIGVERDGSTVESYEYDENDNRTSRTVDGTTESASYAPGDRVTDHGGTTYSYDADGFVTDRGGDEFEYSAAGDLLSATPENGSEVTYTYDGFGRRVARSENGDRTEYLYADRNVKTQVTVARDPDGTRTQYYYDVHGRAVAFDRDGDRYYVATDQVGTPRVVVADDGTVVREIDRDSYGRVRSDSNPDFPLHVGFAGGIPDPSTGLVRFGMRDYDPETGRWLARDPLLLVGDQFNFYSYVENDPINGVDRTGLSWECWAENFSENFGEMLEKTDIIGKLLDELGVDTGTTDFKSLFKGGIKTFMKELAKGAGKRAAAKAAAEGMLKGAVRGGGYTVALYGGLAIGSAIYASIVELFGQGPGEAMAELIHGESESLGPCEALERGLIDTDCPEKLPEKCC